MQVHGLLLVKHHLLKIQTIPIQIVLQLIVFKLSRNRQSKMQTGYVTVILSHLLTYMEWIIIVFNSFLISNEPFMSNKNFVDNRKNLPKKSEFVKKMNDDKRKKRKKLLKRPGKVLLNICITSHHLVVTCLQWAFHYHLTHLLPAWMRWKWAMMEWDYLLATPLLWTTLLLKGRDSEKENRKEEEGKRYVSVLLL